MALIIGSNEVALHVEYSHNFRQKRIYVQCNYNEENHKYKAAQVQAMVHYIHLLVRDVCMIDVPVWVLIVLHSSYTDHRSILFCFP